MSASIVQAAGGTRPLPAGFHLNELIAEGKSFELPRRDGTSVLFHQIDRAVKAIRQKGNNQILLLTCVSAYPAKAEAMNLRTIRNMAEVFGCPVGLSDHSLGYEVAVCAVALGACVVEKHFTLSRREGGPDSGFSMEPDEFRLDQ